MVVQRVVGVFAGLMLVMLIAAPMVPAQAVPDTVWVTTEAATPFATSQLCGSGTFERAHVLAFEPPEAGKAYMGGSEGPNGCFTDLVYTVEEAFRVRGPLHLDFFIGCDVPAVAGYGGGGVLPTYRIDVFLNADAEPAYSVEWGNGPTVCFDEENIVFEGVDIGSPQLAPGDTITVRFLPWYLQVPDVQAYFATGPGASAVIIPGLGILGGGGTNETGTPETKTIFEVFEGPTAGIEHAFEEATSDTYIFNWTTDASMVDIAYNATVENGSVDLTVLDGDGTEVLLANLTSSFNASEAFEDVAAGNWSIQVRYAGFTGSLQLDIVPQQEDDGATTGGDGENEQQGTEGDDDSLADGDDGGNTSAATGEKSKGLPGPAPVLVLVALALVVALRRR